ncbi:MAG: hypothetical protein ACREUT_22095 [Steroidobacteraceae bacterium]
MAQRGGRMRRRFNAATLDRVRDLQIEIALEAIATMLKADPTFIPTKDMRTRRWNVCTERGDYEILTTGCKWYDTRARIGGGGAIDLAMHLLGLSFVDAVKRLSSELGADGRHRS